MILRAFPRLVAFFTALTLAGCAFAPLRPPAPMPTSIPPTPSATLTETVTSAPSATAEPPFTPAPTIQPGAPPFLAEPLWAVNEPDGNLLAIDPADNSLAVVIPTGLHPRWIAVAEDFVWALDPSANALLQVDRRSYAILRVLPFAGKDVDALAVGAGAVWIGVTEHREMAILLPNEEDIPQGGVYRLDPHSGEITGYAKTGPVAAISPDPNTAGLLWVLARGQVDTPLLRIDAQSLAFQSVSLDGTADWLLEDAFAVSPDSLWLFSSAFGRLYRAAPDGHLFASLLFPQRKPVSPAALLVSRDGALWLATPWGSLIHYDPGQERVRAEIALPFPAESLTEGGGTIWALSALGGTAYRVDPRSDTLTAVVSLGTKVQPTPRVTPTAIRRATKPCPDAPFSRLEVGARATTPRQPALPNRLHQQPGKDSELSGYIQPGQRVQIIEGPECKDGWVWWKVRNEINHAEGWAAEGDELEYWLIPLE